MTPLSLLFKEKKTVLAIAKNCVKIENNIGLMSYEDSPPKRVENVRPIQPTVNYQLIVTQETLLIPLKFVNLRAKNCRQISTCTPLQ